jgi:yersiniabactin nonribosomal peptide synthetase
VTPSHAVATRDMDIADVTEPRPTGDGVEALLNRLSGSGVQLRADGEQLRVIAPKGALTRELRDALAASKQALLALLRDAVRQPGPAPFEPRPELRHEPFALTDVQHAYWMGRNDYVELGGFSTHCYFELERSGLDIDRLQRSLRQVIARHDMLRAVIEPDGRQRILPEVPPYEIGLHELHDASDRQREAELEALRERLSHNRRPIDQWPLFEVRAASLPDGRMRLFVSLDMLIIDASSMFLFFQEWQRFYAEPGWTAEPLALSYRDYAEFEQTLHEQPAFQRARAYWTERLDTLPAAPDLPLAVQPAALEAVRFVRREQRVSAPQWSRLKQLAQAHGATPSVLLMTAFSEALRVWSREPDFTLNLTMFNRFPIHPDVNRLIGDFTTTNLLAVVAKAGDSFADRLQRAQRQLAEDLEHREYSGMRVLRDRARRLGNAPGAAMPIVFTSTLALDARQSTTDGLSFFGDVVFGVSQTPQVWIDHQMAEFDGELRLFLDAIEALFPDGMLDELFACYAGFLRRLAADPALWTDPRGPQLLPPAHAELVTQANDTVDATLPQATLHGLVAEQARLRPDAVAVIAPDRQLSFAELHRHAWQLGRYLRALGARPNGIVAVMMDKGWEQVAAVFGVLHSGAAYLPIDPGLPAERRRYLLGKAKVSLVVTQAGLAQSFEWPGDVQVVTWDDSALQRTDDAPLAAVQQPSDLAYVLFTSGSTGQPKGVMIEHRNAANTLLAINRRFAAGPGDRVLALSAVHFDLSVYDLFGVLAAGGALVIPSPERATDAAHWTELAQAHRVTLWNSVPQLLQLWVEHLQAHPPTDAPALRQVILSGDWIPVALPGQLRALCPDAEVLASGGPTETAIWCTQYEVREVPPQWRSIPYGKPLANQSMHVLNDLLEPRAVWATGEICIGGLCVGRGYLGDEALTAERFIVHPRSGERLYRSGDLGRLLPDGNIEFLGRKDFQVKLNGVRIELGEIAACLRRQPGVKEALASVVTEPKSGQRQLAAWLVVDGPQERWRDRIARGELAAALAEWLPEAMVPRHVHLLDALPLTPNGKVDQARLASLHAPQDPAGEATAPRSDTEHALHALWREALGREHLGIEASFFDCGGDSLSAIRVVARAREAFGLPPAMQSRLLRQMFRQPSIAGFAAFVDSLRAGAGEAAGDDLLPIIEPDPTQLYDAFPAADVQVAFLMGDSEDMEFHVRTHHYVEVEFDAFDAARYERALNAELQRQRANIAVATPEMTLQVLREVAPLPVTTQDLRGLAAAESGAALARTRERMSRQTLPVDRWPWMEVHASLLDEGRARLHINCNAVFWDGFGTQQFFANVLHHYEHPQRPLPPLVLSFRDCVLALARAERSPLGEASRRYWTERLPHLPRAPELPLAPGLNRQRRSMMVRREMDLDAAVWNGFKARCEAHGLRPDHALFAVYAEILATWSGSRHFLLNNMLTHRLPMHPQMYEIVGNFSALYPLEVDWRGGGSFAARARSLEARIVDDQRHIHWSGVKVLQALNQVHRQPGRAPCPFVVGNGLAMKPFTRAVHGCLETPQVLLDNQFFGLHDGGIWITWDVFEDAFPAGLVDAMWQAYRGLLCTLARDDAAWSDERVDLLPAAQRAQRRAINATQQPLPAGLLHQQLAAAAPRLGDKPAVITPGRTLGHAELHALSNRLGHALRTAGVQPGEPVAILLDRGWEQVVAAHGIQAAGGAYVPLDPHWPRERIALLLATTRARFAVSSREHIGQLALPEGVTAFAVDETLLAAQPATDLPAVVQPHELAYIIFTSGSTGVPKGVMIDHRGALNTVVDINRRFGVTGDDVLFGISSLYFDLSVYDLFGTTHAGARLVLPSPAAATQPVEWIAQVQAHGVTVWNSVPALVQLLVDAALAGGVQLPTLRLVMMSGDWIPVTLPEQLRRVAPNARIVSLGGATEASIWSIAYPVERVEPGWTSIPYGQPLANQTWHVLDDAGFDVPTWVPGALYIGGIGLAQGYWDDDAKTAASFAVHPRTGERLYRTGDLGRYLPDGHIEFLGRADFQVKVQGFRVELGEIEHALLGHADVRAAAVIASGSAAGRQLLGFVVAQRPVELRALQQHLRDKLPSYMVPSQIVLLEQLPLTANGKVDRQALARIEPATGARPARVAPRNDTEAGLAAIWREILELDAIGVHDDFFELGGQSFAAVRVMTRVEQTFGRRLPLSLILEGRTIAALAERLGRRHDWSPLVTLRGDGAGRAAFFVHPAGGNVLCYRGLAQALQRPFHGLQAAGLSGEQAPLDDVPAMAALYLRAVRQQQPQGPYLLGGWSSGGAIAFEMARQLERDGERVEGVVLIDTPAPLQHGPLDEPDSLLWFLQDLDIGFDPAAVEREQVPATLSEALQWLAARGIRSGFEAAQLQPILDVFRATLRATRTWRAVPVDADLLVIKAQFGTVGEFAGHPAAHEADWGWGAFTRGRVQARVVPGNHYTLLSPQNLPRTAGEIDTFHPIERN